MTRSLSFVLTALLFVSACSRGSVEIVQVVDSDAQEVRALEREDKKATDLSTRTSIEADDPGDDTSPAESIPSGDVRFSTDDAGDPETEQAPPRPAPTTFAERALDSIDVTIPTTLPQSSRADDDNEPDASLFALELDEVATSASPKPTSTPTSTPELTPTPEPTPTPTPTPDPDTLLGEDLGLVAVEASDEWCVASHKLEFNNRKFVDVDQTDPWKLEAAFRQTFASLEVALLIAPPEIGPDLETERFVMKRVIEIYEDADFDATSVETALISEVVTANRSALDAVDTYHAETCGNHPAAATYGPTEEDSG